MRDRYLASPSCAVSTRYVCSRRERGADMCARMGTLRAEGHRHTSRHRHRRRHPPSLLGLCALDLSLFELSLRGLPHDSARVECTALLAVRRTARLTAEQVLKFLWDLTLKCACGVLPCARLGPKSAPPRSCAILELGARTSSSPLPAARMDASAARKASSSPPPSANACAVASSRADEAATRSKNCQDEVKVKE